MRCSRWGVQIVVLCLFMTGVCIAEEIRKEDYASLEAYLAAVDRQAKADREVLLARQETAEARRLAEEEELRHWFPYAPEEELGDSTQLGGRFHFYGSAFDPAEGFDDGFAFQRGRLYLHSNFAHFFVHGVLGMMAEGIIEQALNGDDADGPHDFNSSWDSADRVDVDLPHASDTFPWASLGYGKIELDFAGPRVMPRDIYLKWVGTKRLPSLQIGYFKEALGLGMLTSSNDIWFIQRSAADRVLSQFAMDRALGAAVGNSWRNRDLLWSVGYYYRTNTDLEEQFADNHGHGISFRLARLVYENPETAARLHVGMGYGFKRWETEDALNFSVGMDTRTSALLSTGDFYGTQWTQTLAPELLWTYRSLAVQAEYYGTFLDGDSNAFFQGVSVQAGWWLTGEHYTYSRSRGTLARMEPRNDLLHLNCRRCQLFSGPGAWQIAYRFSWIDLSDLPGPQTGQMWEHTVGLNWFWTLHCRWLLDYTLARCEYADHSKTQTQQISLGFQIYY
ncbi:MAG: porin [Planctomycetia bacterium]|nr:porin [Planctomycetia bacterium]